MNKLVSHPLSKQPELS